MAQLAGWIAPHAPAAARRRRLRRGRAPRPSCAASRRSSSPCPAPRATAAPAGLRLGRRAPRALARGRALAAWPQAWREQGLVPSAGSRASTAAPRVPGTARRPAEGAGAVGRAVDATTATRTSRPPGRRRRGGTGWNVTPPSRPRPICGPSWQRRRRRRPTPVRTPSPRSPRPAGPPWSSPSRVPSASRRRRRQPSSGWVPSIGLARWPDPVSGPHCSTGRGPSVAPAGRGGRPAVARGRRRLSWRRSRDPRTRRRSHEAQDGSRHRSPTDVTTTSQGQLWGLAQQSLQPDVFVAVAMDDPPSRTWLSGTPCPTWSVRVTDVAATSAACRWRRLATPARAPRSRPVRTASSFSMSTASPRPGSWRGMPRCWVLGSGVDEGRWALRRTDPSWPAARSATCRRCAIRATTEGRTSRGSPARIRPDPA